MVIVDFHSVMIANIMMQYYLNNYIELNEDLLRHHIINSLRILKLKFCSEDKNLVISCDSKNYWRKKAFLYYKIKRKKDKEDSSIDWDAVHEYMDKIKKEIKEGFNWKVLEVDGAESDDIIGTLVKVASSQNPPAPVLIISRDKDFFQLHKYSNVRQYDSIGGKFITVDDPKKTLFEHICRGDSGDNIPNVVSEANSIAIGTRQKPIFQKKLDLWFESELPEELKTNFERNKQLIDFDEIPKEISINIIEAYKKELMKPKKNLMEYFQRHNLRQFLTDYQDFII
jgi:5'-3' exonuclease